MPVATPASVTGRFLLRAAVLAAAGLQLVLLYAPSIPGPALFPGADKVVHVAIFAGPVLLALLAGLPPAATLALSSAHAPLSELVQAYFIAGRTGDPWDALADLVGIALGYAVWLARRNRARRRWAGGEATRP